MQKHANREAIPFLCFVREYRNMIKNTRAKKNKTKDKKSINFNSLLV
jgi:hypothetical protein